MIVPFDMFAYGVDKEVGKIASHLLALCTPPANESRFSPPNATANITTHPDLSHTQKTRETKIQKAQNSFPSRSLRTTGVNHTRSGHEGFRTALAAS